MEGLESGFRACARQRSFRFVWLSQIFSQIGDRTLFFSVALLAYHLSHQSTAVALTVFVYTVPSLGLSPIAGVLVDRRDKRSVMVWSHIARVVFIALIPVAHAVVLPWPPLWSVLALTFAFASVGQFFAPAEAAMIPATLPRNLLLTANSLVISVMLLSVVIGGTFAPIATGISLYLPYWLAAGAFVVATVMALRISIPRAAAREARSGGQLTQVRRELSEGWRFIHGQSLLQFSVLQVGLLTLVLYMLFILAPAYIQTVIGLPSTDAWVILLPAMAGTLASAATLGQFGHQLDRAKLLVGGLGSAGITLVGLSLVPLAIRHDPALAGSTVAVAVAFSLALGVEFGTLLIPAFSTIMESTDDHVRARVFGFVLLVVNGASTFPVLIGGILADRLGVYTVMGGLGVLVGLTGLLVMFWQRSGHLDLQSHPAGQHQSAAAAHPPGPGAQTDPGQPVQLAALPKASPQDQDDSP